MFSDDVSLAGAHCYGGLAPVAEGDSLNYLQPPKGPNMEYQGIFREGISKLLQILQLLQIFLPEGIKFVLEKKINKNFDDLS